MDIKDFETQIKMSDPQEVKRVLESVEEAKFNRKNKYCATDDLSQRKMGTVTVEMVRHFEKKYGKDTVNTKKFWHDFFSTYKAFSTMDKV